MYIAKGFMTMPGLTNNDVNTVAKFGELPTQSQTYTRDLRSYFVATMPDVEFQMFKCISDMNVRTDPSSTMMNTVLQLGEWIYQQHTQKLIPLDKNKATFIKSITDNFSAISAVSIGQMLTGDPDMNMPDYIQFKILDNTIQYQFTIWFSNDAFTQQYDEYEIFLVPPLDNIDVLNDSKANVVSKLLNQPSSRLINAIQALRGNNPETGLLSYDLNYVDPSNPSAQYRTTWTAICYGPAALDNEAIKDAIRNYIDNKSQLSNWQTIYPDLYSENEFMFIPFWDNKALQDNALQVGLYSSNVNAGSAIADANKFLPGSYIKQLDAGSFINTYLNIGSTSYRTLMYGVIGNPNNKNNFFNLVQLYPDFMALSTDDNDFVRMSSDTQTFATTLIKAFDLAYTYTPTATLPAGFTRMVRHSTHFISFVINGYTFAILTRYAYDRAQ